MLEYVEIDLGQKITTSIIWLHGLGADGHDFVPAVEALNLPEDCGIRFVFPHAPIQAVTINQGMRMRAWYDITSPTIDAQPDIEGMRRSVKRVTELVDAERKKGHRILLAGFSQGGLIALMSMLTLPEPPVAVLALSTYLPDAALPEQFNHTLPIMVMHGDHDPIVPPHLAHRTIAQLQELDLAPEFRLYPMAHSLCPQQLADIREWLLKQLP